MLSYNLHKLQIYSLYSHIILKKKSNNKITNITIRTLLPWSFSGVYYMLSVCSANNIPATWLIVKDRRPRENQIMHRSLRQGCIFYRNEGTMARINIILVECIFHFSGCLVPKLQWVPSEGVYFIRFLVLWSRSLFWVWPSYFYSPLLTELPVIVAICVSALLNPL